MRILVVEDERKIADALKKGLETEGYQVTLAASGEDGFFCLTTGEYDLMLLDLMLPGRDGIEILQSIRKKGIATPILLLTGRDTVEDRVLGLDSGADDYLVKPAGPHPPAAATRASGHTAPSQVGRSGDQPAGPPGNAL